MKRIGLVGGMSPISSGEYYLQICEQYYGISSNYPEIVLISVNLTKVAALQEAEEWGELSRLIATEINSLFNCGCDFVAICSNTPHLTVEEIKSISTGPLVSILDPVLETVHSHKCSRLLVFGTRYVMANGLYKRALEAKGIQCVDIEPEDMEAIDSLIWKHVKFAEKEETTMKLLQIVRKYEPIADGLILACTELPALIDQKETNLHIFDTVAIHIKEIVKRSLD